MNSSAHENFDAVEDCGELVFAGLCVGAAINFAGKPAIYNRRRRVPVAFLLLRNANGKNVAIEFGQRALNSVARGIENFVGSKDVAMIFEIFLFDNAEDFAVEQAFGAVVRETEDVFHQFVVEVDANFGRIDLSLKFSERVGRVLAGTENFFQSDCVTHFHLIYSFRK